MNYAQHSGFFEHIYVTAQELSGVG